MKVQSGGLPSRAVLGKNAYKHYSCSPSADYVACSGGLLGHNVTVVKNLWANEKEGWYIAGSKGALITQSAPKSSKDLVGASCVSGVIKNLDKSKIERFGMKRMTHEFVNGASASVGFVIGPGVGIGANYVVLW